MHGTIATWFQINYTNIIIIPSQVLIFNSRRSFLAKRIKTVNQTFEFLKILSRVVFVYIWNNLN